MLVRKYPVIKGIDIGCGAGWFTRAFYKAGYDMTGLDASPEMLNKAQKTSLKEGIPVKYLQGDITKFKTFEKYGFALAINDCFNYIPFNKLSSAFKNIYLMLERNGIFVFDISSERKFSNKVANTVSVDDREEVTYLSFNSRNGNEVTMDVSLFIKDKNGKYDRFDEVHTQYVHNKNEIVSLLEKVGFKDVQISGHLGENEEMSDRIEFIAFKK